MFALSHVNAGRIPRGEIDRTASGRILPLPGDHRTAALLDIHEHLIRQRDVDLVVEK